MWRQKRKGAHLTVPHSAVPSDWAVPADEQCANIGRSSRPAMRLEEPRITIGAAWQQSRVVQYNKKKSLESSHQALHLCVATRLHWIYSHIQQQEAAVLFFFLLLVKRELPLPKLFLTTSFTRCFVVKVVAHSNNILKTEAAKAMARRPKSRRPTEYRPTHVLLNILNLCTAAIALARL